MRTNGCLRIGLRAATLVLLLTQPLMAEDGRDFAGSYEVSDVVELSGDRVSLRFDLEVVNYSRADVADATVTVKNPGQLGSSFYLFPAASILYRDFVRLSAYFTIPQSEYDSWERGSQPTLGISFYDAGGNLIERPIEVTPFLLLQEEN